MEDLSILKISPPPTLAHHNIYLQLNVNSKILFRLRESSPFGDNVKSTRASGTREEKRHSPIDSAFLWPKARLVQLTMIFLALFHWRKNSNKGLFLKNVKISSFCNPHRKPVTLKFFLNRPYYIVNLKSGLKASVLKREYIKCNFISPGSMKVVCGYGCYLACHFSGLSPFLKNRTLGSYVCHQA